MSQSISEQLSTVEVLELAKALIDTPEKWFGCYADRKPNQLCAVLALNQVVWNWHRRSDLIVFIKRANRIPTNQAMSKWNDSHTHAEVMNAFDRAIELARQESTHAPHP